MTSIYKKSATSSSICSRVVNKEKKHLVRQQYMRSYRNDVIYKLQRKAWLDKHKNYYKKWRKTNTDYHKKYYQKRITRDPQYFKKYREKHRARLNGYWRLYRRQRRAKSQGACSAHSKFITNTDLGSALEIRNYFCTNGHE